MRSLLSLVFLFCISNLFAQDVQHYYSLAKEAYKQKDFNGYYTNLKEANRLHPYHQVILYQLGVASALTDRTDEAISSLHKALLIDASFQLEGDPDLKGLKGNNEFNKLIELQEKLSKPIIQSDTALIVKERTLHAEGIEYYSPKHSFYVGSIHERKVIEVKQTGEVFDFCKSAMNGMTSVFGIKVDEKRKLLWVCSSPMQEMIEFDSTLRSAVFKFDLTSGKLIEKFQTDLKQADGVFGDLILERKGEVYVSDTKNNTIYKVDEKNHTLKSFYSSESFWNMQGLAFSSDERFLFISDYIKGIFRLNLINKELTQLSNTTDTSLKGIDGVYFYKNQIIAIQNGVTPARVTKYTLDKDLTEVMQYDIIDQAHPAFNEPTLGVKVKDSFYYIANSQWSGYEKGIQKPASELQDIIILKAKLD